MEQNTAGAEERNALPENLALHARNCAMVGDLVGMRAAFRMLEEKAHRMPGQSQEEALDALKLECADLVVGHYLSHAAAAGQDGKFEEADRLFADAMKFVLEEIHTDALQRRLKYAIVEKAKECFKQIAAKFGMPEATDRIRVCSLFTISQAGRVILVVDGWLQEQRKKQAEQDKAAQG